MRIRTWAAIAGSVVGLLAFQIYLNSAVRSTSTSVEILRAELNAAKETISVVREMRGEKLAKIESNQAEIKTKLNAILSMPSHRVPTTQP